jgi:hypothetical protein
MSFDDELANSLAESRNFAALESKSEIFGASSMTAAVTGSLSATFTGSSFALTMSRATCSAVKSLTSGESSLSTTPALMSTLTISLLTSSLNCLSSKVLDPSALIPGSKYLFFLILVLHDECIETSGPILMGSEIPCLTASSISATRRATTLRILASG